MTGIDLQPGNIVGRRYEVQRQLGTGILGAAYLCRDLSNPERRVAVKVLAPLPEDEDPGIERSVAGLLALRHPSLAGIYEVGSLGESRIPFIATEYVSGQDVVSAMKGHSVGEVVSVLVDICRGLQVLHASGIVHGDLKPGNIHVCNEGQRTVKLSDYGLMPRSVTPQRLGAAGSLSYVAPEILLGHFPDPRTDLYSLGIIAFVLLARRLPFDDEDHGYLLQKHLQGKLDTRPLKKLHAGRSLSQIIRTLVDRNPEKRPSSADEVVRLLSVAMATDYADSFPVTADHYFASAPFIGRKREMEVLQSRAEQVMSTGRGWTVFVTGAPGVGKSRLMEEFRTWGLLNGWRVLEGSCSPAPDKSYPPFRQILAATDSNTALDSVSSRQNELFRFDEAPIVPASGALDKTPDFAAGPFRDRLTRELVRRIADRPTIVLLHDFQWSDEGTTAVLDYLTSDITSLPVMVCVSHRTAVAPSRPITKLVDQCLRQKKAQPLSLESLGEQDVEALAAGLTGSADIARRLGSWLHRTGGGNPLFVQELLKHLVDRGLLSRRSGRWEVIEDPTHTTEVPDKVASLISDGLKLLSPQSIRVARWIAVFRRAVSRELLALACGTAMRDLDDAVAELLSKQLVRRQPAGADECVEFCHTLVREVVLCEISARKHRDMHFRIGEVLEQRFANDLPVQELAHHFTRCESGSKATQYALRAAAIYRSEFAYESALELYEYALTHGAGLQAGEECEVIIAAAEACCALGRPKRAIRLLNARIDTVNHGNHALKCKAILQLSRCYQLSGDIPRSRKLALQGLSYFHKKIPPGTLTSLKAFLLAQLAFCLLTESRPITGLALARKALVELKTPDDARLVGHIHTLISGLCCIACRFKEGRTAALRAIEILTPLNAFDVLALAYSHLGINLSGLGRFGAAIDSHRRALDLSNKSRAVFMQCQAMCNLAECYSRTGQMDTALDVCRDMMNLASSVENDQIVNAGKICLVGIHIARGEFALGSSLLRDIQPRKLAAMPAYARAQALYYDAVLRHGLGDSRGTDFCLDRLKSLVSVETPIYESTLGELLRRRVQASRGGGRQAIAALLKARRRLLRLGWLYQVSLTDHTLASIREKTGDLLQAQSHAKSSVRLARILSARIVQAESLLIEASILSNEGHLRSLGLAHRSRALGEAQERAKAALEIAEGSNNNRLKWRSHVALARLALLSESTPQARIHAYAALRLGDEYEVIRSAEDFEESAHTCRAIADSVEDDRRVSSDISEDIEESHLKMLLRFSGVANSIAPVGDVVECSVNFIADMFRFNRVHLLMRDTPGGVLQCAGSRFDGGDGDAQETVDAIVRHVDMTQCPFITADAEKDQRMGELGNISAKGTIFCGPIRCSDGNIGILYTSDPKVAEGIEESQFNAFAAYCNIAGTAIQNAVRNQKLEEEKKSLEQMARQAVSEHDIVGSSQDICVLRKKIALVGSSPLDVLITGECGTGKELVARALHRCGRRRIGCFMALDCGSLSDNLIESELFGYRKGAFTGANENRPGLIEAANGGILFLDEISNLPRRLQSKLLRVLQEREVRRLGDVSARKVDIQVFSASNQDLGELIRKGRFRKDLYYRLRGAEIRVPALRCHLGDIPELVTHFLREIAASEGGRLKKVERSAMTALCGDYRYPGNVRELRSAIRWAYYSSEGSSIQLRDLPEEFAESKAEDVQQARTESVIEAIQEGAGNFEDIVKAPFLKHEFGRDVLRDVVRVFLRQAKGNYRRAFRLMRVAERDYAVTIQFLKRHGCFVDFRPFRRGAA
jgi:DNA-binding NtrC family response regulator/tetratricopeptide (TPR) repeat protein